MLPRKHHPVVAVFSKDTLTLSLRKHSKKMLLSGKGWGETKLPSSSPSLLPWQLRHITY